MVVTYAETPVFYSPTLHSSTRNCTLNILNGFETHKSPDIHQKVHTQLFRGEICFANGSAGLKALIFYEEDDGHIPGHHPHSCHDETCPLLINQIDVATSDQYDPTFVHTVPVFTQTISHPPNTLPIDGPTTY